MSSEKSFQIKSLYPDHKCCRNYNLGSLVTYRWIAEHYAREIIDDPWVSYQHMQNSIRAKFLINVSLGQCKRAKQVALYDHEGGLIDHYGRIWDYRQALLDSNPGSTCHIDLEDKDDGTYFKRIYVCFAGLKNGWLEGCRKVIGLDGCFLTHTCKGQLLTAMGRDANNQMFPIAWAVVGVENKNNWSWFLSLLTEDLKLTDGLGVTVISDGHKGLLEAVKTWLYDAEHRQCGRHIYANFKKKWCGLHYKRLFWKAASSTMNEQFLQVMAEIKALDENAYTWLIDHDPNTWCRAYFEMDRACASLENGISESFNSKILSARGKPIITMLEDIRVYLMQRVWVLRKTAMDLNDTITPYARRHVEFMKIRQRKWVVYASGFQEVEVRRQDEAFGVNLQLKKCACRLWELCGLPCVHAVAGYTHLKMDPVIGVSEWYAKNKWVAAYEYSIRPVPGTKLWKKTDLPKPLPPGERKLPGRPKKKRIRHPSEFDHEIPRVGRVMHCHRCWETGHNKAKCKNAPVPKPPNFWLVDEAKELKDTTSRGVGPSSSARPTYKEDPVMPPSELESKRKAYTPIPTTHKAKQLKSTVAKDPAIPSSSNRSTRQVHEASGSKMLTPEEHAEAMDREAFAEMVRKDAENKAKDEEMWREAYEEERKWEEYRAEFNEWEFREEEDNRIGISLCVGDDHHIGNQEPASPVEQTEVFGSDQVDEFPDETPPQTPQAPTKRVSSSAPAPELPPDMSEPPKKKTNKKKKKSESTQPLPFRIYHKNRGRSERIAMLQLKKFKFDANGTGSTPDKAFDVSDSD